jgi:hypothetical protein
MTEEQRQHALALCARILETAAKLEADLRAAKKVIEEFRVFWPKTASDCAVAADTCHRTGTGSAHERTSR